ncbi:MAG: hypothetical protein FWD75_06650 [Propionibacteriaceae bacterium]|nr:hypothetical protein [Propionibacteriaceae bacterium]
MEDVTRRLVGCAPVGVGKTLAELAPAWVAASRGRRTVVSTDSLALQSQIMTKDAPVVAQAATALGLPPVTIAVHKGWSNYACALACVGVSGADAADLEEAEEALASLVAPTPVQEAALWGVREALNDGDGDRHQYTGEISDKEWSQMSVQSTDCPGATCPFVDVCLPRRARDLTSKADIVVTNHTLLAIQAATGAPVVTGNTTLGVFDSIIVDECHALPGHVRSQGATEVSGRAVLRLVDAVAALKLPAVSESSSEHALTVRGRDVAALLDNTLASVATTQGVTRIPDDARPLDPVLPVVSLWLKDLSRSMSMWLKAQRDGSSLVIPLTRLLSRIAMVREGVDDVNQPPVGVARWAERHDDRVSVKTSPVDVSAMLSSSVWRTPGTSQPVNVVCLSATVPAAFGGSTGLGCGTVQYPSAFTDTYRDNTALLIPSGVPGVLTGSRLDLDAHRDWAARTIVDLVSANGGSALVLAATTSNGQTYTAFLRRMLKGRSGRPKVRVLSQWDGTSVKVTVDEWKKDQSSILVGTRSLMTGVDAPGTTNTLVIIDRVPRAAPNPVDDARVLDTATRAQMSHWDADRIIYYGDARTLLQQAAGRLIRSTSDTGMVAILDPRLAEATGGYKPPTRSFLMKAVDEFGARLSTVADATAWLAQHRTGSPTRRQP